MGLQNKYFDNLKLQMGLKIGSIIIILCGSVIVSLVDYGSASHYRKRVWPANLETWPIFTAVFLSLLVKSSSFFLFFPSLKKLSSTESKGVPTGFSRRTVSSFPFRSKLTNLQLKPLVPTSVPVLSVSLA